MWKRAMETVSRTRNERERERRLMIRTREKERERKKKGAVRKHSRSSRLVFYSARSRGYSVDAGTQTKYAAECSARPSVNSQSSGR